MDPVAQNLLQFLPAANLSGSRFQGVPTEADDQDQFTVGWIIRLMTVRV